MEKITREEVHDRALSLIDNNKTVLLELATGFGKTKLSIDLINHICDRVYNRDGNPTTILIIVAKTVHKNEWFKEIEKWGGIKSDYITIECYNSLDKYVNRYFDVVIFDEVHHLSVNKRAILKMIHINELLVGLSATIKDEMKEYFEYNYNAKIISCGLKKAIDNNILPDPEVYLIPLKLDNNKLDRIAHKFKETYRTTQKGYYKALDVEINYYKNLYNKYHNQRIKQLWLRKCKIRLEWLSSQKEDIIKLLHKKFNNSRTITFCSTIEQCNNLGKFAVHSKNKKSLQYVDDFNNKKIKHLTSVNILNEGCNLVDCRIGIFCNLNGSDTLTKQRIGRILRHKKPIIIVPYYVETREEELVELMKKLYSKDKIHIIYNIKKY